MALQTKNGRSALGFAEKEGYSYKFWDKSYGMSDPETKFIMIPRIGWEDSAWILIHEAVHIIQALQGNGMYSADKGWPFWRLAEVQAYGAQIMAYREYQRMPGNQNYTAPGTQGLSELWDDKSGGFNKFIDDTYRPLYDALPNAKK